MKKLFIFIALILFLTACGGNSSEKEVQSTEQTTTETKEEKKEPEEKKEEKKEEEKEEEKPAESKNLSIDDTWEVPGLWKLKINSVKLTDDRNEFSDKTPAQVFIIDYTYENLGYEDETMDLYLTPDRVMDDSGKMGYGYPASITNYPQQVPVGGSVDAQDAFGVDNETKTVKIYFSKYDNDLNKLNAVFEVPVE